MSHIGIRDLQKISSEAIGALSWGWGARSCSTFSNDLASALTIVPAAALEPLLASCEVALRDAVASRDGSTRDAHVLASAWSVDADVWTTDRDFAGTGVATWSTPSLMGRLAEVRADRI